MKDSELQPIFNKLYEKAGFPELDVRLDGKPFPKVLFYELWKTGFAEGELCGLAEAKLIKNKLLIKFNFLGGNDEIRGSVTKNAKR